VLLNRQSFNTS